MKEEKKKINDKLIKDKHFPTHNFITLWLVNKGILTDDSDSEFELYLFDGLFEQLQNKYEFKTILISVSYIASRVKQRNFKDESGRRIKCLYAYFRSSLVWNLKLISGEIDLGWLDEDFD